MDFVSKIISFILAENTDDNSSETESFEECDADSIVSIRYLGFVGQMDVYLRGYFISGEKLLSIYVANLVINYWTVYLSSRRGGNG